MTYSKQKKEEVEAIIDEYASEWLDRYTLDDIKSNVEPAMKANNSSNKTVANTIFNKLKEHSGDLVLAVASEQLIPENVIYIICNNIIDALK